MIGGIRNRRIGGTALALVAVSVLSFAATPALLGSPTSVTIAKSSFSVTPRTEVDSIPAVSSVLMVPFASVSELRTWIGTRNSLPNSMARECNTPAPLAAISSIHAAGRGYRFN